MRKDVIVSVRGLQFENGQDGEAVESIQRGEYFFRGKSHYVLYDELVEGLNTTVKNTIKFSEGEMHLSKKGAINVNMDFVENQKNLTDYRTPYGNIVIGLEASRVSLEEEEKKMKLEVDYTLDVNYEYLADCKIRIDIHDLEEGTFSLRS